MEILGNLKKMQSELKNLVEYTLPIGDKEVKMNDFLGREINFEWMGEINCIKCGRQTNKSFSQGYGLCREKLPVKAGSLFDDDSVINIRKFGGYLVRMSYEG